MELRDQQYRLKQLQKYLPTLQLKKAMLQTEVNHAIYEINGLSKEFTTQKKQIDTYHALLSHSDVDLVFNSLNVSKVKKRYENIAGAEIPFFEAVEFTPFHYSLFDTPLWIDSATTQLQELVELREKIQVVQEKKTILEKELREVSIRVNLFEKILIPRTQGNIKKIAVFLGDQELASVAQAKVAKTKVEMRKKLEEKE